MEWLCCGVEWLCCGVECLSVVCLCLPVAGRRRGGGEVLVFIDAGGEGGPSAYWHRRFHFQLENEFPVTNSRGGPREWSD